MQIISEQMIEESIRILDQHGEAGFNLMMDEFRKQQPVLFNFSQAASQFKKEDELSTQQGLFTLITWLSFYRTAGPLQAIEEKNITTVQEMIMERIQLHRGMTDGVSFGIDEIFGYFRQQHLLNFLRDEMELLRNEGYEDDDVNQILNSQLIIIYLLDEALNGETTLLN